MPAYAPLYQPPTSQQAFLTREQKRERKRKRDGSDDDDDEDQAHGQSPEPKDDTPRVPHPVNRTDPYYVAGHSRDKPLPTGNFPHAAVKEFRASEPSVEEVLANLNPPLFTPRVAPQDQAGSLKRRHLDNLTAILHQCMLRQDWARASRVWGLILRTEIQGYGPDIRRNGHWMIGAEILMRRGQTMEQVSPNEQELDHMDSDSGENDQPIAVPVISDDGFELARKYYERLILQYPHRPRAPHSTINALAIYPALFSIWIYEVHDKANRAGRSLRASRDSPEVNDDSDAGGSVKSDAVKHRRDHYRIKSNELEGALAIAQRMDDLMLNPPFDTSSELLRTRGMVGLWLSDLHQEVSDILATGLSESSSSGDDDASVFGRTRDAPASKNRHIQQSESEKQKARRAFEKMAAAEMTLPANIQDYLDNDDRSTMLEDDSG